MVPKVRPSVATTHQAANSGMGGGSHEEGSWEDDAFSRFETRVTSTWQGPQSHRPAPSARSAADTWSRAVLARKRW